MLKKLSFIKKIFTVSFALWTVAILVSTLCSYGLARLLDGAQLLDGTLGTVVFYLCESGLMFSGALICYWASPYRGKRLTESPTDSMKELLDRIVREYTSGPCMVIDLTFKTPELRDAMCAKLTEKLLGDLYREAAEEAKVALDEDPKFYTKVIECKWPNNVNGNEGTKNIQVKQK
ncbi:MAG: hypothetical protein IKA48_01115 [Fibrobacter sp.]|nr:hypothetical protein [Fibrobacter sp.]